jgi:hypothetical protein
MELGRHKETRQVCEPKKKRRTYTSDLRFGKIPTEIGGGLFRGGDAS